MEHPGHLHIRHRPLFPHKPNITQIYFTVVFSFESAGSLLFN